MLSKIRLIILIILSSLFLTSCSVNSTDLSTNLDISTTTDSNTRLSINTTELNYTIKEYNSFKLNLLNENLIEVFSYKNRMLIFTMSDSDFNFKVFDILNGQLLKEFNLIIGEFLPKQLEINDDYIIVMVYNNITSAHQVLIYNYNDSNVTSLDIDSNLKGYENSIDLYEDSLLLNLQTVSGETGYAYLIDLKNPQVMKEVTSYPITTFLLGSTREWYYGGKNHFVDDFIVMSSIDYVLNNEGVGIYSRVGGEFIYHTNFAYDESCSVISADVSSHFVSVKTTCDSNDKLYIFDILNSNLVQDITFYEDVSEYKLIGINQFYIVLSNASNNESDAKIKYLNLDEDNINDVSQFAIHCEIYGSIISLYENNVAIYTTINEMYNIDLESESYSLRALDTEYSKYIGIYGSFIIFEYADGILAYDVNKNESVILPLGSNDIDSYYLCDSFFSIIYEDEVVIYKSENVN